MKRPTFKFHLRKPMMTLVVLLPLVVFIPFQNCSAPMAMHGNDPLTSVPSESPTGSSPIAAIETAGAASNNPDQGGNGHNYDGKLVKYVAYGSCSGQKNSKDIVAKMNVAEDLSYAELEMQNCQKIEPAKKVDVANDVSFGPKPTKFLRYLKQIFLLEETPANLKITTNAIQSICSASNCDVWISNIDEIANITSGNAEKKRYCLKNDLDATGKTNIGSSNYLSNIDLNGCGQSIRNLNATRPIFSQISASSIHDLILDRSQLSISVVSNDNRLAALLVGSAQNSTFSRIRLQNFQNSFISVSPQLAGGGQCGIIAAQSYASFGFQEQMFEDIEIAGGAQIKISNCLNFGALASDINSSTVDHLPIAKNIVMRMNILSDPNSLDSTIASVFGSLHISGTGSWMGATDLAVVSDITANATNNSANSLAGIVGRIYGAAQSEFVFDFSNILVQQNVIYTGNYVGYGGFVAQFIGSSSMQPPPPLKVNLNSIYISGFADLHTAMDSEFSGSLIGVLSDFTRSLSVEQWVIMNNVNTSGSSIQLNGNPVSKMIGRVQSK